MAALTRSLGVLMIGLAWSGAALAGNAVSNLVSNAPPGAVGPFISSTIYGNTSNPSGNGNGVLPSLTPGPWSCTYSSGGCTGAQAGSSMGDIVTDLLGVEGDPLFANDNDAPPGLGVFRP